jgi:hypothetical protein
VIDALRRHPVSALALGLVLLVAAGIVVWVFTRPLPDLLPAPSQPELPDLVSEITEVRAASGVDAAGGDATGRTYLRFTTSIANRAAAPLVLRADRRNRWTSDWRVTQRFDEADGGRSESVLPGATLVWGGHGHDHWHLRFGTAYRLEGRPPTDGVRVHAKAGYCFFDQLRRLPAARNAAYPKDTCDGIDRTSIEMGLTPGWSDPYQWTLPDQLLEVTGLDDGTYRLYATADPDGLVRETNERNNVDWVDLRLTTSTTPVRARVIARAPRAIPTPS